MDQLVHPPSSSGSPHPEIPTASVPLPGDANYAEVQDGVGAKDSPGPPSGGMSLLQSQRNQWDSAATQHDSCSPDAAMIDEASSKVLNADSTSCQEGPVTAAQCDVPTKNKLLRAADCSHSAQGEGDTAGGSAEDTSVANRDVNAASKGNQHLDAQHQQLQNQGESVKIACQGCSLDEPMQSCDTVVQSAVQGAPTVATGQEPCTAKSRSSEGMSTLFKSKALEIVKEKRLSNMSRFASETLASTVAKVEQYVASASVV